MLDRLQKTHTKPTQLHYFQGCSHTGHASGVCALLETRADIAGNSGKPSQKPKGRSARITRAARECNPAPVPRESGRAYLPSSHAGWTQSASRIRLEDHCNAAAAWIGGRCSPAAFGQRLRRDLQVCCCVTAPCALRAFSAAPPRREFATWGLGSLDKPSTSHPKISIPRSVQHHESPSTLRTAYLRSGSGPMR